MDRCPPGHRGRGGRVRRVSCAARYVRPAESRSARFRPAVRARRCDRLSTAVRLHRSARGPAGWRLHQTSERSGSGGTHGLAARSRAPGSVEAVRARDRARRSVILGEPVAPVRSERMAVGARPAGSSGLSPGADHHACPRVVVAFKRDSEPSALLGALFLASFATLSLALPMRMVAFWNALPPASRRPPVVAIRDERRRRTAAVCLLRGVPASLLVDDQTRRRDPPGGNHRLLARVRLVSHHAESRTANQAAGPGW